MRKAEEVVIRTSECALKDRNTKTEVARCYMKRHDCERSKYRRSTRLENMENALTASIGKRPEKKKKSSDTGTIISVDYSISVVSFNTEGKKHNRESAILQDYYLDHMYHSIFEEHKIHGSSTDAFIV